MITLLDVKVNESRFWKQVKKTKRCWLWNGINRPRRYGSFTLGKNKSARPARFSWTLHNKKTIPKGLCICHKCDVPSCVKPDHLFLGTHQDNMDDMIKKGRNTIPRKHKPRKKRILSECGPETLLSESEAASLMQLSRRTLQAWRLNNVGPAYMKLSYKVIRYRLGDVQDWLRKKIVKGRK